MKDQGQVYSKGNWQKNCSSIFWYSTVAMPFSKSIGFGFLTRENPSFSLVLSAFLANFATRDSVPPLIRSGLMIIPTAIHSPSCLSGLARYTFISSEICWQEVKIMYPCSLSPVFVSIFFIKVLLFSHFMPIIFTICLGCYFKCKKPIFQAQRCL